MNGFSKNSATQAADPPASPKPAAKAKKDLFFQGRVGTRQIDKFWQKIVSANHLPYSPSIHIYTLSSKPEPCQDLPKAKGKQAEDTKEAAILGMGSNMFQLFLFPLLSSI